jgi:hypothetical protein
MSPDADTPEWIAEMHAYYGEHGYYRVVDLERGLGSMTESVGAVMVAEPLVNLSLS